VELGFDLADAMPDLLLLLLPWRDALLWPAADPSLPLKYDELPVILLLVVLSII
tara:strand:+ start:1936 stop:2097 length:162 start_codon:yes stop_codon:yes gene_type:complete